MSKAMLCALGMIVASAAFGQGAPAADPEDPAAPAPPLAYRSAFDGYKPFADEDVAGWREANDEVRAAGGHAGHRPGQGPGAQTSKPQPGTRQSGEHGAHHQ